MPQMKEQEKSPEKELNEIKATKTPDSEFKTMIKRMFKDLRGRLDCLSENLNKGRVSIKKLCEMKNTISEIKNTLEGINNSLAKA